MQALCLYPSKPVTSLDYKLQLNSVLRALGLNVPRDLGVHTESYLLTHKNYNEYFSSTDKEMLRLFFHPSLRTGMTKNKILEIVAKYYDLSEFKSLYPYKQLENYLDTSCYTVESQQFVVKQLINDNDRIIKLEGDIVIEYDSTMSNRDKIFLDSLKFKLEKFLNKNVLLVNEKRNYPYELVDVKIDYHLADGFLDTAKYKYIVYRDLQVDNIFFFEIIFILAQENMNPGIDLFKINYLNIFLNCQLIMIPYLQRLMKMALN